MMPLLLILMVMLALVSPEGLTPLLGLGPWWSTALTLAAIGLVWLMAEVPSRVLLMLMRRPDAPRARLGKLYHRWRGVHTVITCLCYVTCLLLADWGYTVRQDWGLSLLLDELAILAPLVAMLVTGWWSFWAVEHGFYLGSGSASAIPFWTRGAYVSFHVRNQLAIVLVPVLGFSGLQELFRELFPFLRDTGWSFVALLAAGLLVLIVTPWMLKLIWSAGPLEAGLLRCRLEAAARRLRFRCTDILLWNTRGGVANAMVAGLLPYPRFVLLSDCLVNNLTAEEVEAVFGHEIGHIRHHHMPLYLTFFMLSIILLPLVGTALAETLGLSLADFEASWSMLGGEHALSFASTSLAMFALAGGYIYLVFGFLSRRCERQADVFGCKLVSCGNPHCTGHEGLEIGDGELTLCPTGIRTFISALERVADLNGIPRGKPSWRHASIARRVAFLESLLDNPTDEPRFQRRLMLLKCGLLVGLALLGGLAFMQLAFSRGS
jgi:STE24 endopeptidase